MLWNVGWKVLRGDREFVDEDFRAVRFDNDRIVNLEISSFPQSSISGTKIFIVSRGKKLRGFWKLRIEKSRSFPEENSNKCTFYLGFAEDPLEFR